MEFTKDSAIVKSYILLIEKGLRTLENVPDLYKLREAVERCLSEQD